MKLINPLESELNEAFAKYVAGWTHDKDEGWRDANGVSDTAVDYQDFSRSADAVLPWLEKCEQWDLVVFKPMRNFGERQYSYVVICKTGKGPVGEYCATQFARAAVIALLRAHGVEVEFSV